MIEFVANLQDGLKELKDIVAALSRLKNELQTNKPLTDLPDDGVADNAAWNKCMEADRQLQLADGLTAAWFVSSWLLIECYFYRRIMSAIRLRRV